MSVGEATQIRVHIGNDSEEGEVYFTTISYRVRFLKVLFSAVLWALITFVNMMTPVIHLVLGPLSIFAGIYCSFLALKGSKTVVAGSGTCPKCKKTFDVITGKYKFPVFDICTHCGREVKLCLKDPPPISR